MQPAFLENLRKITPYVPGEQPKADDMLKLNANENPYPPSPEVERVLHSFACSALARYPDANSRALKHALAVREGLQDTQVFVGNGSDDVLALAFQSFFCGKQPILFPDLTYSFYPVWCDLFGIPFETVPVLPDFRIDLAGFARPCGGVVLPNPNAPTGIGEPLSWVAQLLEQNPACVVIIDEAYVDFGAQSATALLARYDNLLVVQTASKSRSLAGLRLGWAFGSPMLIATLEAVKNSYNSYTVDALTIAAGTASIEDDAYFRATCQRVMHTRDRAAAALAQLGFAVTPSQTNFLLVQHKTHAAKEIFEALRAQNIYVRYFALPRIDNHLRITIGTDAQMTRLLDAIKQIVAS